MGIRDRFELYDEAGDAKVAVQKGDVLKKKKM